MCACFFFFNDTATTEIYTLSLHDALPICASWRNAAEVSSSRTRALVSQPFSRYQTASQSSSSGWLGSSPCAPKSSDRKSTRLNSSHANISYAVFCLKKKKRQQYSKVNSLN